MCEKAQFACEIPLHVAEAAPPPGQPPLSRPTDQKPINLILLPLAQLSTVVALARVKVSPGESFTPIIGVMPNCVEVRPMLFNWLRAPCAAEMAAAAMSETECP